MKKNTDRGWEFLNATNGNFQANEDEEYHWNSDESSEYRHRDGSKGRISSYGTGEYEGADGSKGILHYDGSIDYTRADGTRIQNNSDGSIHYYGAYRDRDIADTYNYDDSDDDDEDDSYSSDSQSSLSGGDILGILGVTAIIGFFVFLSSKGQDGQNNGNQANTERIEDDVEATEYNLSEEQLRQQAFTAYQREKAKVRKEKLLSFARKNAKVLAILAFIVAKEDNFMFSYNITNMNANMKRALNRERTNVGRSAYTPSIKNILKNCISDTVLGMLVKDIKCVMSGTNKDESGWADISSYAVESLNKTDKVVFMTPAQRDKLSANKVEILQESGKELILITDKVYGKVCDKVVTYDDVATTYFESFKYEYVDINDFNELEKKTFNLSEYIFNMLLHKYDRTRPNLKISETIRMEEDGSITKGVWDSGEDAIIIKREVLSNMEEYAGVLFHEFAHYATDTKDISRDFENVLTDMLGYVYMKYLKEGLSRRKIQKDLDYMREIIEENKKLKIRLNSAQEKLTSDSIKFSGSMRALLEKIKEREEENEKLKIELINAKEKLTNDSKVFEESMQELQEEIEELRKEAGSTSCIEENEDQIIDESDERNMIQRLFGLWKNGK